MQTSIRPAAVPERRPRATAVVIPLAPRVLAERSRRARRWARLRAHLAALVRHERFAELLLVGATLLLFGVLIGSLGHVIQIAPLLQP